MTTQTQVELALLLWSNNDYEGFQKIIQQEQHNILNYKGRGDIFTYFLPAILIESFWNSLENTGFPMEKIVYSHRDVVGWLQFPKAVLYMHRKDKAFITDIIENGIYEEQLYPVLFEPHSRDLETVLSYFHTDLRKTLQTYIESYLNMSESDWDNTLAAAAKIISA